MTMGTEDYAVLAKDTYHKPEIDKDIELHGVHYQAIDYMDDPITGFQATAYQRMDTQEVVIAFRGTEFDRQPIRDGGVDVGMVLTGVNAQTPDALAFTQRIIDRVKVLEQRNEQTIPVTVTGHSLGGTLAEITASRFGLHGETFNAYGAAGLLQGIPEGGHQVIDHVRATDLVSSASPHFGEVRIYAVQQDIDTLTKAGYRDDSTLLSPRNPFKAIDFSAHAMDNFVPNSPMLGQSIINPQAEALYHDHQQMIDRYRNDVLDIRTGLSAGWEVPRAVVHGVETAGSVLAEKAVEGVHAVEHVAHDAAVAAEHAYENASAAVKHEATEALHTIEGAARSVATGAERAFDSVKNEVSHDIEAAGTALHAAGDAVREKAASAFDTLSHPGSWFHGNAPEEKPALNHPSHPDHALFQQARGAVHQLDASHQRAPDERSDNLAASLALAARRQGMNQIDHVVLSDDASRAYAVQGDLRSPFKHIAQVDTAQATATPVEQSSAAWPQAQLQTGNTQAQNAPAQQVQPNPPTPGP